MILDVPLAKLKFILYSIKGFFMQLSFFMKTFLFSKPVFFLQIFLLVSFVPLSFALPKPSSSSCTKQYRGIVDLGSGLIKMDLAQVDVCADHNNKIQEKTWIHMTHTVRTAEHFDYAKGQIDRLFLPLLIKDLKSLKASVEKAFFKKNGLKSKEDIRWSGIATAIYRKDINGEKLIEEINHKTGLNIRIISQEEEGALSFNAVISEKETKNLPQNAVLMVWDLGGASTQISWEHASSQDLHLFKTNLGTSTFKKELGLYLKRGHGMTLHPILKKGEDYESFLKKVTEEFIHNHPSIDKLKFEDLKNTKPSYVIGVGGFHELSICPKLCHKEDKSPQKYYTKADLKLALKQLLYMTDQEITSRYPFDKKIYDVIVSDILLSFIYMEALGFERVHIKRVSLGKSLLQSFNFKA
jgi:exopolyphosphatase/guanosine-5'-triphosphate,3'-diphosphate pyrophosphatase